MLTIRHFVTVSVGVAIALSYMEVASSKELLSPTDNTNNQAQTEDAHLRVASTQKRSTASPQDNEMAEVSVEENTSNWRLTLDDEGVSNSTLTIGDVVISDAHKYVIDALSAVPASQNPPTVLESTQDNTDSLISPVDGASMAQSPAPINPQPPLASVATPTTDFLNPSANPLQFPTESQEVQVQVVAPITLEQAIAIARRNNRDLQEGRLTLERAQAQLRQALAAYYPTASVQTDLTRADSAQGQLQIEGQPNPSDANAITTSLDTNLQLSYNLYSGGRRSAQVRAAEEAVRLQQLDIERRFEQLRLDTTVAYYDLQEAAAQVEIAQAAVVDATRSLRDAQLLEQAGLGTRFDVLQAQVSLANANQTLTSAQSQLQIAQRQLAQVLSLDEQAGVSTADPIEVAGEWNLSLEQSIILAYRNRAELEQQVAQRTIDEQQRIIALSAVRPQVTLSAGYDILEIVNDDLGTADGLTLAASVRWNFYDGGSARAAAEQERINREISETNFADLRNQIRLQVEQAFYQLRANADNIQTASFALEQAQESLRLARLRFQAGVGTQADVITQQTELTRARGSRLAAILDYNRALAQLQRSVSNLPDSELFDLP